MDGRNASYCDLYDNEGDSFKWDDFLKYLISQGIYDKISISDDRIDPTIDKANYNERLSDELDNEMKTI